MVELSRLVRDTDTLLQVHRFRDYCPNGLQVEGRPEVRRLATGVTACQALLDAAAAWSADVILVHHGYFWKGEDPCLRGLKRRRIATLIQQDISLLAYHLPLDAHAELGNNVQLAKRLDIVVEGCFGADDLGRYGRFPAPLPVADCIALLTTRLQRPPLHIAGGPNHITRIAWCTGAAQRLIEAAADLPVDAFLSGEVSEQTVHIAHETGVHYFAAGHHATERYGVQALGEYLAATYGLTHRFFEIDNPV